MFYYFAGGLFSHKELIGNHLLAEAIELCSNGRWQALLPQQEENQQRPDALDIRDNDLSMIFNADAALFNFDGSELDSGTVAEFMAARFLDLPCVLFRSDFRSAGDQNADGEPWNLMLSGYPRTETLRFDCMAHYQEFFKKYPTSEAIKRYYELLASKVTARLDAAYASAPVLKTADEKRLSRTMLANVCGGTLPQKICR